MKSIAVFCGSSTGASEAYINGAREFGKELAKRNIALIYGGASVGVMGAVADAVLDEGGQVIGVMPDFLEQREISHKRLSKLVVVNSMHERKAKIAELADCFVALPGGPGTLDEFFEIFTWSQLGLHEKACGLLNTNNYFEPLIELFNHMIKEQFLDEKYSSSIIIEDEAVRLLDRFNSYESPTIKTYTN